VTSKDPPIITKDGEGRCRLQLYLDAFWRAETGGGHGHMRPT
jgi:hypothetical protein